MNKGLLILAVIAVAVMTTIIVDTHVQCIPFFHTCVVH